MENKAVIKGAFWRIKTGEYRCVCANAKAKDKYISNNFPFAIGASDDTAKDRWIYFTSENDAKVFIDKYYKYLNSNAYPTYIRNPRPMLTKKVLELGRIDNAGEVAVYCPVEYAKNINKNIDLSILPKRDTKIEEEEKIDIAVEASKLADRIGKVYSEITGFKCSLTAYGINKEGTISLRLTQYLNYGCSVLTYKPGTFTIKRVERNISDTEITNYVKDVMIYNLCMNLQRCYFSAHNYMKMSIEYDAQRAGVSLDKYIRDEKYLFEAINRECHCEDINKVKKFIKAAIAEGKLVDERYLYLNGSSEEIAERYLKLRYPKISKSQIAVILKVYKYDTDYRMGICNGIVTEKDFAEMLSMFYRAYPEVTKIIDSLNLG